MQTLPVSDQPARSKHCTMCREGVRHVHKPTRTDLRPRIDAPETAEQPFDTFDLADGSPRLILQDNEYFPAYAGSVDFATACGENVRRIGEGEWTRTDVHARLHQEGNRTFKSIDWTQLETNKREAILNELRAMRDRIDGIIAQVNDLAPTEGGAS